jgi:anthranilate phosphoribosyltransferase
MTGVSFDPRPLIKEIARGKHAARDLTREQARDLFEALLSGEVTGAALGAVLTAFRIKGETASELAGMMDALATHVRPMRLPSRRALPVVIATYNGSRKLPNLVPLLSLLLAREEVPVLLHGVSHEPTRVATFEILEMLGHAPAATIEEAEERLEAAAIAPVPIAILAPDLARLLDVRLEVGVRNSGHTLAKLLLPQKVEAAGACRLIAVTHPDFLELMRTYFASSPANVFLMRGVEGEAVVRLHAPQPIEQIGTDGTLATHVLEAGEQGPPLPAREAAATAEWTRDVLSGRVAVPTALVRQVALIATHCRNAGAAARALRLVSSR